MPSRSDSPLAEAAADFATELANYSRLGRLFLETPLGSVKHLERANQTLGEIAASEVRLVDEFKKKGNTVIVVDKNAFRDAVLKTTKPTDLGYRQQDYDRIVNIK